MARCEFQLIQTTADGHIYQCHSCGIITAPTPHPASKVFSECIFGAAETTRAAKSSGVGSELTKLLHGFGITYTDTCSCKTRAEKMDRYGVQWCRDNVDKIVGWLTEEAQTRGWPAWRWSAKVLVLIAIRRAERNEQKAKRQGTAADIPA